MLASTEMRERVTSANNSTIKLVPANTVVSINRDDIETEVIQAVKKGPIYRAKNLVNYAVNIMTS